ncbi:MAG: patatin-like phospholipase family protein [Desulfobacteraceae bacterium]|jgi:hypothetical protein
MSSKLTYLAGSKALATIKEKGLTPDMIRVMAGAAGGPKWIILSGLDRYIFSSWLTESEKPVHLLGSSIGAYRFAAAMRKNPEAAIDRLLDAYIHQAYVGKPTAQEVTDKGAEIIYDYLDDQGVREVLSHPFFRLNILAVKCLNLTASERKAIMIPGLIGAALANVVSRNNLKYFFRRTLFYDGRTKPPFYHMNQFPVDRVPLSPENLRISILASGSIPIVMSGIEDIPGTTGGMFRDGGVLDYHMDIPYGIKDGIVLFPHYTDRIVPGWLDKQLKHRKPDKVNMENLLLICPSRDFIATLPYAKIPDRNDFKLFFRRDDERFAYWITAAERSRELADEFCDVVATGKIRKLVRPLD